ncbi:ParA family protein [Nocardia sp. CA-120079]|uniref:ParA family protein n=1 Tax=Nocardia sp. CA-120079 TaxID=3239974 RepID=UPI003D97025A
MAQQPRRAAFANQKGGVGKTQTVLGITSAVMWYLMQLEAAGQRDEDNGGSLLVVDCDPSADATMGLGVDPRSGIPTVTDLLHPTKPMKLVDVIQPTKWDFVDVIAGHPSLANAPKLGSEVIYNLDIAFESVDLSMYRGVLFDTPPTLGDPLYIPLCAADELVIVAEPAMDSTRGTGELVETMERIQKRANQRLELGRLIINGEAVPQPTIENRTRTAELKAEFGDLVSPHVIKRYTVRGDAHSARTPIHLYEKPRDKDKITHLREAYDNLAREQGLIPAGEAA